ncbi:hypothetical protein CANINC_004243 [Pichia inconspicua]|uniref:Uncharacterized protein n=1 Tax=Pichia inconspicua TaxID=52247 RepID=A0A4T0WX27_9ASCO|nr:hypothetical protein CANINC_004243 [[Candida] inconspicua]
MNTDHTATVEKFLSTLLSTLDAIPPTVPLPQLSSQPRIIINGQPFSSKEQFQQLWSTLPISNHQVTSCDIHTIPTGQSPQFIVLAHAKVRFDESGKNKLGDSTLLHNQTPIAPASGTSRALWSHWFGVTISCVIDYDVVNNPHAQCVTSWDYRFTENPTSSIYKVE